ncbi:hypothetical protein EWF20_11920 [Sulfolobus sp. S-194]|uniref:hypothetical protein n=1 Tax=Sulfolobus sp. S-194 TaxID=2512240 RepID=UPI001436D395|nr:hypothetical protein [Sulfolobus sp. S-194]QIW24767.1 hypothetical protein EWF20_11920 [Sulfolobus sp. S-194]
MLVEIYLNLLEFKNSISNYILENEENGWNKIRGFEGEYYYKEFSGYAILVSANFPLQKGYVFEHLKVNKLREILDQPGKVKYYLTLDISNNALTTTEEDCLDTFPGIDVVNGMLKDFQFFRDECCVRIITQMDTIDDFPNALNRIINGFQLYYSIVNLQEQIAINYVKNYIN